MRTTATMLAAAALLLEARPARADLVIPNTFTAGTKASAAEVNANFAAVKAAVDAKQPLVKGTCAVGSAVTAVNADGTVSCAPAAPPAYVDAGLAGKQDRVAGTCAGGAAVRAVNPDGSVVCTQAMGALASNASVPITSTTSTWVGGVAALSVPAGASIWVTASYNVFALSTTSGAPCTACAVTAGNVGVCFRPAGGGTPVVQAVQAFFHASAAPVGDLSEHRGGMFSQGVFSGSAGGSFEFGLCASRNTSATDHADFAVFWPNVVAIVR